MCLWATAVGIAFDYADARSKAAKSCEAISPSDSQSGLYFNPEGYRSYYVRSKCFQEAAVLFRDPALCEKVRQRWSLTSSSRGYSAARCRQLVAEGTAADRAALKHMKSAYAAGGIRLRDVRIERNGNGRDVDIVPTFAGTYAHGYTLTFELLPTATGAFTLLHSLGYYVDEKSNLRIYVPQADIKRQFPGSSLNRVYTVRATVTLDVGLGGQSGYWSPAFTLSEFPTRAREQSMIKQAAF